MELSSQLGPAPVSVARLSVSEQKPTFQPDADAATVSLNAAGPAAIYHPSEEAQALGQTFEVIETWIGRPQSSDFALMAARQKNAGESLKASFETFQSALQTAFPDLASKKFGFTIEADGSLKALDNAGGLSASDSKRLNTLLNASSGLKAAASGFRDASIDVVEADSPWSGSYMGKYSLTKENFASTIDLAALFIPKGEVPTQEHIGGFFINQLASKGELQTREGEAALLARRAAAQAD